MFDIQTRRYYGLVRMTHSVFKLYSNLASAKMTLLLILEDLPNSWTKFLQKSNWKTIFIAWELMTHSFLKLDFNLISTKMILLWIFLGFFGVAEPNSCKNRIQKDRKPHLVAKKLMTNSVFELKIGMITLL